MARSAAWSRGAPPTSAPRLGHRASTVTILLALFGGMALLLYGIRLSGEALQRVARGPAAEPPHRAVAPPGRWPSSRAPRSTALIQSSAATTLDADRVRLGGLMTFRQTLGVILGADIGTTFTVQLIAFRVTDYSPLLVGLGFTVTFICAAPRAQGPGPGAPGARPHVPRPQAHPRQRGIAQGVARWPSICSARSPQSPAIGVLVGAVFSALVTSSAATLGLALAFAHQGLLPLDGAVAIVLGANIGTCATALTASVGATAEAKRVAVAHIAFKVLGAALVFPFIGPFTAARGEHRRRSGAPDRERPHALQRRDQPAVPAVHAAGRAGDRGDGARRSSRATARSVTRYLDERSLDQPSLALGQATREALRMADVVQGMLRDVPVVFASSHHELLEDVERRDDQVDFLEREIKLFLARLGRDAMGPDLNRKEIGLISVIGNLENIGDIIDKNLMELGRKKLYQARRFSDAGWAEIQEFHGMVSKNLERAIAAFAANDRAPRAGGAGSARGHAPAGARAARIAPRAAARRPGRVDRDVGDPPGHPDQPEAHQLARVGTGDLDSRGGLR